MRCSYACAQAARRTRTPESRAEYHRAYREKNRAWINEKQKAARVGPRREQLVERRRQRYYENLATERERARDYGARHREDVAVRLKAWAQDNPERVRWHSVRSNIATQMGVKPRMVPDFIVDTRIEFLDLRRAIFAARGMSAFGQDPKGLEAKPASPVRRTRPHSPRSHPL